MTATYLIIALCCFITGLAKGGLGGALGSLVTPLLVLVMPAPLAVGISLPILIAGDIFAVGAHWGGWDRQILIAVMPGTIVGVIVGSLVLGSLSSVTLQHGLGLIAILYVLYKVWERTRRIPVEKRGATSPQSTVLGAGTGFASTLANAGGPVFTIYMLMWRITPAVFVGTSALYFAILNAIKIPGYLGTGILTPERILLVAWALPFVPFGVWSGILLDKRLDMGTFEKLILIFLVVTGVVLLLK
jgi:uncharacterized membrane protein YfcA